MKALILKRDLPVCLFLFAFFLLQSTIEFKRWFPTTLGRSEGLIFSFGAVASLTLAVGLSFALRNLFLSPWPGISTLYACLNLLTFAGVFALHILMYVAFSKIDDIPTSFAALAPKFVDSVRTAKTEEKRKLKAQWTYRYLGLDVAYRRNDGTFVEFAPTPEDVSFWQKLEAEQASNKQQEAAIIKGQLNQLPTIMTINGTTFLIAFIGTYAVFAFGKRGMLSSAN